MSQSRTRRPDRPDGYWPDVLRILPGARFACDLPADHPVVRGLFVSGSIMTRAEAVEVYGIDPASIDPLKP